MRAERASHLLSRTPRHREIHRVAYILAMLHPADVVRDIVTEGHVAYGAIAVVIHFLEKGPV